jgi:predicted nicotinamide N-methyase
LLNHPETVMEKRVLDLASGSGVVSIAAAMSGARSTVANDTDSFAETAISLNADVNQIHVKWLGEDLVSHANFDDNEGDAMPYDVILAGDVFYDAAMAEAFDHFVRQATAAGKTVLVSNPGRSYFRKQELEELVGYEIPVIRELEDLSLKRTSVWRYLTD